jgi:hypothetical protein
MVDVDKDGNIARPAPDEEPEWAGIPSVALPFCPAAVVMDNQLNARRHPWTYDPPER